MHILISLMYIHSLKAILDMTPKPVNLETLLHPPGMDGGVYPTPRVYTLGFKVAFNKLKL